MDESEYRRLEKEATAFYASVAQERDRTLALARDGSAKDLLAVLESPIPKEFNPALAKAVGVQPSEPNALCASWLINDTMFLVDSGIVITNPRMFHYFDGRLIVFGGLLSRFPDAAMTWFEKFKDENPPTLFNALVCGDILSAFFPLGAKHADDPWKKAIFKGENALQWQKMLSSKNPLYFSTALHLADKFECGESVTPAIARALKSEWVSLQLIGLETAESIKPPGVKKVIEDYANAKRAEMPDDVARKLGEKTQSVLKSLGAQK